MNKVAIRSISLVLLAVVLLMCSCVTKMPYGDEQYFQGLGLDGEFVITVNAELIDPDQYIQSDDAGVNYIKNRMTRLSIALYDNGTTSVADDFSTYDFYGAIEGNISKTLVNSALSMNSRFNASKDEDSKLKFFVDTQSGMEAAVPTKGIILFSSTDVVSNYNRTFVQGRQKLISDEQAAKLASSQIGIYVSNPKTMIDLGLDISQASLANIETVLMVMDDDVISIDFKLKSQELADSFSILIKAGYVGNLRKNREKADVAKLKQMFTQELDKVYVNGIKLPQEQKDAINEVITSLLSIL